MPPLVLPASRRKLTFSSIPRDWVSPLKSERRVPDTLGVQHYEHYSKHPDFQKQFKSSSLHKCKSGLGTGRLVGTAHQICQESTIISAFSSAPWGSPPLPLAHPSLCAGQALLRLWCSTLSSLEFTGQFLPTWKHTSLYKVPSSDAGSCWEGLQVSQCKLHTKVKAQWMQRHSVPLFVADSFSPPPEKQRNGEWADKTPKPRSPTKRLAPKLPMRRKVSRAFFFQD